VLKNHPLEKREIFFLFLKTIRRIQFGLGCKINYSRYTELKTSIFLCFVVCTRLSIIFLKKINKKLNLSFFFFFLVVSFQCKIFLLRSLFFNIFRLINHKEWAIFCRRKLISSRLFMSLKIKSFCFKITISCYVYCYSFSG
jgi:hypothetical protein